MRETRNFLAVIGLIACVIWAALAWFLLDPQTGWLNAQRIVSVVGIIALGALLIYAFYYEDKLPNHLRDEVGELYYEADGLSFLPVVRLNHGRPELRVYYQNRFENPVQAIVHLRPPDDNSFVIRPGMRDIHFAFRADGGDFGVIHQPIHVPERLRGQVIDIELAAATYYPRSHGAQWRRQPGLPCGSVLVDWTGAAFRTGVHEASGELELIRPVTVHLSMPQYIDEPDQELQPVWRQERLFAGSTAVTA